MVMGGGLMGRVRDHGKGNRDGRVGKGFMFLN